MKRISGGVLIVGLALALPAPGQEPAKDKVKDKVKEATPAQQYKALVKEFQDARMAWQKTYQEAKTDEERQKSLASLPQPDQYAPKFLTLAEKHPSDPVAVEALVWVVSNTFAIGANTPQAKAFAILERDHLKSDKLADVCATLSYRPGPDTEKFLRAVLEKNPHRSVQGAACLGLAQALKNGARGQKMPESLSKEIEDLFQKATDQYGDVKTLRGTVGERARAELFEVRFLAIGKTAPEVEGEDQDSVKFKLSDYRGKVVLIDFWGNW
jgi:hypothetical protein